ncbi:MAG: sugar phosphate isomerase/epimerase [Desulfobacterales bacterium]|nr:sugar phosphate isomerase/epimerase [Desulfobacterales bacterium]
MIKQYSLAYLTVYGCAPPEMTYIAARTGYDFVSLRLIPMGVPGEKSYLPEDKEMISKTKAALNETGVKVLDIELARIVDDVDPCSYIPAMEAAADLGAKHVISSAWTTDRNDRNFIIDRYAEICDLAKPLGLTVNLEFPTFSRLTNLQEAVDIVRAARRSNGGVFIDTLYFHYSSTGLDELEALPREWFNFMHICDTSEEIPTSRKAMLHVARDERLYFGEGCINFTAILGRLPPMPYSIELPNIKRLKQFGFEGHARRCLETAKQHLDNVKIGAEPVCHAPSCSLSQ